MPEDKDASLRQDEATPSTDDLLKQLWSLSTTLSEETMSAASNKAKELEFDQNRGVVSLAESFINLSSARGVLEDAIEKQKLVQLPITVQKEIFGNLQDISKSLKGLIAGTDEIINLVNSIETLNTSIWKYGLHNLSDQVLGYQKKLNQIKTQEVQISRAMAELEAAQKTAQAAIAAAGEIEQKKLTVSTSLEQIQQNTSSSASYLEQLKDTGTKASTLYATIQQQEKQSGELSAGIKTSNNELLALDASIRKFYSEVEDYRKKINQTGQDAAEMLRVSEANVKKVVEESESKMNSSIELLKKSEKSVVEQLTTTVEAHVSDTKDQISKLNTESRAGITALQTVTEEKLKLALENVEKSSTKYVDDGNVRLNGLTEQLRQRSDETIGQNQIRTEELLSELAKLKDQIREQIQQATGFQLFGAFQARQNEISKSKLFWVYAIFALVCISAGVTVWVAHEAKDYNLGTIVFWVKLSITIPLGFALAFCTVQYSRERRLEEEYAFKASISVSLNPYRDLIHSILAKDGATDQNKYSDFVVDTVRNVFTPPTDKIFEAGYKPGLTEKTFEQAAKIIGTAVKAAK